MAAGFLALAVEVGLACGIGSMTGIVQGSLMEEGRRNLVGAVAGPLFTGAFTWISFIVAAFLVRMALAQSRGIFPMSSHALQDLPALKLLPMAIGAALVNTALSMVWRSVFEKAWGWIMLANTVTLLLLTIPVLIAIPLVADGGRSPIQAPQESIRLMLPNYWRTLDILIKIYLLCLAIGLPVGFVTGLFGAWWLTMIVAVVLVSAVFPYYYIVVALIYSDLTNPPAVQS
jgi:hypothetical protein